MQYVVQKKGFFNQSQCHTFDGKFKVRFFPSFDLSYLFFTKKNKKVELRTLCYYKMSMTKI